MATCSSCGHANLEGAKFCMECASPLREPARSLGEERKVITALFCDLVGFTAASESADPEDVDRMLNSYFATARTAIESFGGVVEKFIGDAVVGVFGVPAAHEDDPERAVRAALRICEASESLTGLDGVPLRLRIGINTGGALVRLGVTPGSGEGFVRGDAINTASRLQSIAPEMGVVVGEGTYKPTAQVFDYEELEPATLKGKADSVRVFRALSPRARFGIDLTRTHDTPFVGREEDLALLKELFDTTVAASSPQLATIAGEPGLGKSRIVAELFAHIDERPELTTWRQGRCLPYGDGITFWALGEILKAHAGILESDDSAVAAAKLDAVLPTGSEREWFRQRLLPLLGIEATSSAEREEAFTAWRRFIEHMTDDGPVVLVFEDLHWADAAMLAFIEHLAERAEAVPLLVVGTARPELFERRPDFAGSLRNHTLINLAPLSVEETARLVSALLETSVIPAELQTPILERSDGNPLYAEEFVRLLKDKDLLVRRGTSWELAEGAQIPLPDSVQALIAARLDALPAERKALLHDAAVVGKVFWAGTLAHMGRVPEDEVRGALHELSRVELVRSVRRSSMEGEAEYSFWHVLTRDVAYGQIPRSAKAVRHVAAAEWIEAKASERLGDLADVLSHHYASALQLAVAAGESGLATELEGPALRFLILAGERALELDMTAALDAFERALGLVPEGHSRRAEVLARFGEAAVYAGRYPEGAQALEDAAVLFRDRGDLLSAAGSMGTLHFALDSISDPRVNEVGAQALALLETEPPGRELMQALRDVADDRVLAGDPEGGLELLDKAVAMADELVLPRPRGALRTRGHARCQLGDAGGIRDIRAELEGELATGRGRDAAVSFNNLGFISIWFDGYGAALEILRAGIEFCVPRGLDGLRRFMRSSSLMAMLGVGEVEQTLDAYAEVSTWGQAEGDGLGLLEARSVHALASTYGGSVAEVTAYLDSLANDARHAPTPDLTLMGLGGAAVARVALGEPEVAVVSLAEIASTPGIGEGLVLALWLPPLIRAALSVGRLDLAEGLVAQLVSRTPLAQHALVAAGAALAEARGDLEAAAAGYEDAAARWEGFDAVVERGFALLGEGRCRLAMSQPGRAVEALGAAREIFAGCGMRPALEETDALLTKATALSS